jgi:hypothetical protein
VPHSSAVGHPAKNFWTSSISREAEQSVTKKVLNSSHRPRF